MASLDFSRPEGPDTRYVCPRPSNVTYVTTDAEEAPVETGASSASELPSAGRFRRADGVLHEVEDRCQIVGGLTSRQARDQAVQDDIQIGD